METGIVNVEDNTFDALLAANSGATAVVLRRCTHIPDACFSNLQAVRNLEVYDCPRLSLDFVAKLQTLQRLKIEGLSLQLPDYDSFQQLNTLTINFMATLSSSIMRLPALEDLEFVECNSLSGLPEPLSAAWRPWPALRRLRLNKCYSITSLPDWIGQLTALTSLEICECDGLVELPEAVGGLPALRQLELAHCRSLRQLPEQMAQLTALEKLGLTGCRSLRPPELVLWLLLKGGRLREVKRSDGFDASLSRSLAAELQRLSGQGVDLDRLGPTPTAAPAFLHLAAAGGGIEDRPVIQDTLGVTPMTKGTAEYLLDPDTRATTLAVYGSWGAGKSTFMKLVEAEMLLLAANQQVQAMEPQQPGAVRQKLNQLLEGASGSGFVQPAAACIKSALTHILGVLLLALAQARRCAHMFRGVVHLPTPQPWRQLLYRVQRQRQQQQQQQQQDSAGASAVNLQALTADNWEQVKALASPRLLTVWFNSWQYLTEQEVWAGLVVEVTKQLEARLGITHRWSMLGWFRHICAPFAWLQLSGCFPMKLCVACKYNCRTRGMDVFLRCLVPLALVLVLIGAGMGVGIWELQQQQRKPSPSPAPHNVTQPPVNSTEFAKQWGNKGAVAAVAVMGIVTGLLAALVAGLTHCKHISDSIVVGRGYMQFKDHGDRLGYQAQVIRDLKLLQELLRDKLTPLQRRRGQQDLRIVVFIDDIDRCKPSSIIQVLEAVNVVLSDSGIAVVVGMDKDYVLSGIQNAYKDIKVMQSLPKAQEFLQKIVQVELMLPKPAHKDIASYMTAQGIELAAAGVELGNDPFSDDQLRMPAQQPPPTPRRQQQQQQAGGSRSSSGRDRDSSSSSGSGDRESSSRAGWAWTWAWTWTKSRPRSQHSSSSSRSSNSNSQHDHAFVLPASQPQQPPQQPPQQQHPAQEGPTKAAAQAACAALAAWYAAKCAAEAVAKDRPDSGQASHAARWARFAEMQYGQACNAFKEVLRVCNVDGPVSAQPPLTPEGADAAAAAGAGHGAVAEEPQAAAIDPATVASHVEAACLAAKEAKAAALKAQKLSQAAAAWAAGRRPSLGPAASNLLGKLLRSWQLEDTSPRELKRLLNRYLLAWLCCEQQVKLQPGFKFEEQELLAWVFLWWRFPQGMSEVFFKFKPKDRDAASSLNLAELLELQQTETKPVKAAGQEQRTEAQTPMSAASASPVSASAAADQNQEQHEEEQLSPASRLLAAQEAVRAAKDAAASAALAAGDNAADLKKAAQDKVDAASLQDQLAKMAVLCCEAELGPYINLPAEAMRRFRPFGL